jgi:DNA invertase Pin-like site-specific DNA recombinase
MKQKAYSYLRISTPAQEMGDGIRRQIEGSTRYAEQNGLELVETFQDLGISGFKGKNSKEGALGAILMAIDDGRIEPNSVLIVESLDRLSRESALAAFAQFAGILSKKIEIVTLMDGQRYTEQTVAANQGLIFTSLGVMIRANEESEIKSKRLKAAWERKRTEINKRVLTEKSPAWLVKRPDGTGFEVDEKKADIVRKIFELCIAGVGIYSIARLLNTDSEVQPIASATRWNNSYISKILHNRAVLGEFQPNRIVNGQRIPVGEVVANYYPRIVDDDTFILAQNSLSSRREAGSGRKGEALSNLFSGLLVCGNCGGSLTFRNKGKRPKGGIYLRCTNALLRNGCDRPAWRYEEFEQSFIRFVSEIESSVILSEDSLDVRKALIDRRRVIEATLNGNKEKIRLVVRNLLSDQNGGDFNDELRSQGEKLGRDNETLKAELDELELSLSELDLANATNLKECALALYKDTTEQLNLHDLYIIRSKLAAAIRRTVTKILVFNGIDVQPWEVSLLGDDGVLSERYLKRLSEKGLATEGAISAYLATPKGSRDLDRFERHYQVVFKSGGSRIVYPFGGNSILLDRRRVKESLRRYIP